MIVLWRKRGETIVLRDLKSGNEVRITLLASDYYGGRLGIDAPIEVSVVREELEDGRS